MSITVYITGINSTLFLSYKVTNKASLEHILGMTWLVEGVIIPFEFKLKRHKASLEHILGVTWIEEGVIIPFEFKLKKHKDSLEHILGVTWSAQV